MTRQFKFAGLVGMMLFMTCAKDSMGLDEGDFFIFGTYHGFCRGECVTLYRLVDGKLYLDDMERLDPEKLIFQSQSLPDSSYQKALSIWKKFPEGMLEEPERIGIPDAHDQGGYFIRLRQNGEERDWYIDTVLERLPDYVQQFITYMNQVSLP